MIKAETDSCPFMKIVYKTCSVSAMQTEDVPTTYGPSGLQRLLCLERCSLPLNSKIESYEHNIFIDNLYLLSKVYFLR